MPTKPETKTTAKATSSDTREPWITRLRISRPKLSVPSAWAEPIPCGAFIMAVSSCLFGSLGASTGPAIPIAIKATTITPPVNAFTCSCGRLLVRTVGRVSVADSRVNDCIESVNNQVNRHERHGVSHHQPGDERIVARVERGDKQAAAARPGENGFDDDRAAQQRAKLEADDRNHRNERIARHMAPYHLVFRQSFGARSDDVVLVHHFQNR